MTFCKIEEPPVSHLEKPWWVSDSNNLKALDLSNHLILVLLLQIKIRRKNPNT